MSAEIVILTGAGVSAESGLGTFRDVGGLWDQYDLSEVATPEGFAKNPALVLDFYNARRRNALGAEPNAAHDALSQLQADHPGGVMIVTQNIDDLHERAGTSTVTHMHGELFRARCTHCAATWEQRVDMAVTDRCLMCNRAGGCRPDIVWFGEMPMFMEEIADALAACRLFVSIGTSGSVYPAAGFVAEAKALGKATLELNLEPSDNARVFDEGRYGPASEIVPAWAADIANP